MSEKVNSIIVTMPREVDHKLGKRSKAIGLAKTTVVRMLIEAFSEGKISVRQEVKSFVTMGKQDVPKRKYTKKAKAAKAETK